MILIDMKMPKSGCTDCLLVKRGSIFLSRLCAVTGEIVDGNFERGGFPTECPLQELPPHGRLIDADALIRDWPTGFVKTADVINNAPAIIPVSEEDET